MKKRQRKKNLKKAKKYLYNYTKGMVEFLMPRTTPFFDAISKKSTNI